VDKPVFAKLFAKLWLPLAGSDPEPALFECFWEALGHFREDKFERVCRTWARRSKFKPTIAALLDLAEGNPRDLEAPLAGSSPSPLLVAPRGGNIRTPGEPRALGGDLGAFVETGKMPSPDPKQVLEFHRATHELDDNTPITYAEWKKHRGK